MQAVGASAEAERPARRTRQQILTAALSILQRTGLTGARVEDILVEANVSRATFYRYFSNMDAVIIELAVDAARAALATAVESSDVPGADSPTRIARVIAAMAGRKADPPILAMLSASNHLLRISNLVTGSHDALAILSEPLLPLLRAGQADGSLRRDLTTEQMVEWLTRNAASIRNHLPPWAQGADELERYVSEFVMPALLAPCSPELAEVISRLDAIERRLDVALPAARARIGAYRKQKGLGE